MMAQSLDGVIAKHNTHFPDWTCARDKKMFKYITQKAGALIMGSQTYRIIGRPLPGRLNVVYTRHPEKLAGAENVLFTAKEPADLLSELKNKGYKEVILTGGSQINSLFIKAGLIDEILLTVAPKLFGSGLCLFSKPVEKDLSLISCQNLDADTLLLKYRILKGGKTV
ncbi:MAG: dihydrofolate reductase [Desulfobacteraceae bacterium]|nr:dihydrofolate reductase [Desulfobacteraceae bacterium]